MHIQTILKNFGLNEKETAIYMALIELGPSPVRTVAARSKVNRGTTYDILRSLMEQGLVTYYNTETHQHFAAESPEKLLVAVEDRRRDLKQLEVEIEENLPELKSLFEREGGRPQVRLYEGLKGIKQVLEDVLSTMDEADDKEYYVYSSANLRQDVYEAMPKFTEERIKRGIRVKTIGLGDGGQTVGLDERKWLGGKTLDAATYEIIYGDKVAHLSLTANQSPVGILIQNSEIYRTQKTVFNYLWEKL